MAQTDSIPRFRGEEGAEEAGRWLENFIASTGSFSDSGIFRFIQTRFPVGSPSRVWFDKLDEAATTSWKVFESRFRDRWVANHESEEWKRFKQHHLTEDMIFKDGSNHQTAQEIISVWADDHLVWGKSLDSANQVLTDTTKRLLPPFIQAYLEAFIGVGSQRFEDLCQAIKSIPLQVINLELLRRRISSDNWRSNMEKRIVEISAKVDRLITNTGRGSIHAGSVPCLSSYVDAESRPNSHTNPYNDPSTTSLPWEACSALTSVPSETGASHISTTPSTPTAELISLSSALDGTRSCLRS
ncbi:hypothetical protein FRC03_002527 [Tulasnella sp. 419]|nr:hypothetical protein FRC03_002527 [Tulasnella sp. 419]